MKIDLKSNQKVRYVFYLVGLLIWLAITVYIYINFIEPTPGISPDPAQTQDLKSKKISSKSEDDFKANMGVNETILKTNPFVELSSIRVANSTGSNEQAGINRSKAMATGNEGLPQIPSSFPKPTVGSLPLPAILGGGNTNIPTSVQKTPQAVASAVVQGVFTGTNGKNMAIMSDGKIVSTGDTYQDDRISYIGGDGIQFNDGHTISYK